MDRLIFGDNQFLGVSHMSEEKGMLRAQRFQNINAVIDMLDTVYDEGIHAFSFSTNERVKVLCDHFRAHPQKYADLRIYPAVPYARKYANAVNEKGVLGAVTDALVTDNTAGGIVGMLARGSTALLTKNPIEMMKLLVDAELKMFHGLKLEVVFLQNNVTDLMLGFGIKDIFREFVRYVEDKYQARAGFQTLNMPMLVDFLIDCGIENPIVCSAINKLGFQMHPDVASYERTLKSKPFQALAMSVMAAGSLGPTEAFEYVFGIKQVKSILFGASTRAHLQQTKALADKAG